jgi:hypothetical protein
MAYKGYPSFGWYAWMLYLQEHRPGVPHLPTLEMAEPDPSPWKQINPDPLPWIVQNAVSFLVSAVTIKDVAVNVSDEKARKQMISGADAAIAAFVDDYCGTPPRLIPWPWPGPPPWVVEIASALSLCANNFQEGVLRDGILAIAGQLMQRGAGGLIPD